MNDNNDLGGGSVPALRPPDMADLAEQLVAAGSDRGIALTGEGGLLSALTKQVLQSALEAEMSLHPGHDKHSPQGRNKSNSLNGSTPKTVTTEIGQLTVQVPRDRDGSFEPKIIAKHQRRLSGFDEQVVSLYAKGMTTGDIVAHLEQIYDRVCQRNGVSGSIALRGRRSHDDRDNHKQQLVGRGVGQTGDCDPDTTNG